jgi:hypothetical protein
LKQKFPKISKAKDKTEIFVARKLEKLETARSMDRKVKLKMQLGENLNW